jgi:hypothetical protein
MAEQISRWLGGFDAATRIERWEVELGARWAAGNAFWLLLAVAALVAMSLAYYVRVHRSGTRASRLALGLLRAAALVTLLMALAEPTLHVELAQPQTPLVYVVIDGTGSMDIADDLAASELAEWHRLLGDPLRVRGRTDRPAAAHRRSSDSTSRPTRQEWVRALLAPWGGDFLKRLATTSRADLEVFLFEGQTTSHLRRLQLSPAQETLDAEYVAGQLTTRGQVTDLGNVLTELARQAATPRLAAVVLISDFAHNTGPSPLVGGVEAPAARLGVPIHTVGVGAVEAIDLAVELLADPKWKKGERSNLVVQLRQHGLDGQTVQVQVAARPLGQPFGAERVIIGQREVALNRPVQTVEMPYLPEVVGHFELTAQAQVLPGELIAENNEAARQVQVLDDYLRLMYVAFEPNWEWRFIKEVFHRDKLVGMEGFRTFLSSSDPRVRQRNILFLPTLTPRRSEFFATDVLFLDDMPRDALGDRFPEMVRQFVGELGGGLVVLAGPRFGPRELYPTPLAEMLPVILDPQATLQTAPQRPPFRLQRTAHAARYPFMRLGESDPENDRAWENLGELPWYQPVAMPHPQADVLAQHPTDRCADGKTPQPLIAIRKYGQGEVVWLGFNEMWRLRRRYGERYYRQFWSQLIYRLGMGHALGPEKRFVARLDRSQVAAEQQVTLSVDAYDEEYLPLAPERLPPEGLTARWLPPPTSQMPAQSLVLAPVRPGLWEVRFTIPVEGTHRFQLQDPLSPRQVELRLEVAPNSAERHRSVRDEALQRAIAQTSGGRTYDLRTVHRLPEELRLSPPLERHAKNIPLWATPWAFTLLVGLLLVEWLARKRMYLP